MVGGDEDEEGIGGRGVEIGECLSLSIPKLESLAFNPSSK